MTIDQTKQEIIKEFLFKFHGLSQPHRTKVQTREQLESFLSASLDRLEKSIKEEFSNPPSIKKKTNGHFSALMPSCPHCGDMHMCPKFPYKHGQTRPLHHWTTSKMNAEKRGLEHSISKEYLWAIWIRDEGWKLFNPSIDRIDPKKGYIMGNVRFIEMFENNSRQAKINVVTEKRREASRKNIRDFNIAHPIPWNKDRKKPHKDCSYEGCNKNIKSFGLCSTHYERLKYRRQHDLLWKYDNEKETPESLKKNHE